MRSMLAYLEDDPAATYPWLTWEVMTDHRVGSSFEPQGRPERVAEVKPGTKVLIIPRNLYLLVWTAPDGTLRGAWRQILTLIGFDKSAFRLTSEPAVNPAASRRFLSGNAPVILAYNRAEPSGKYSIRATVANAPLQQTLDIAPAGASAPRIVFDGTSQFIFWSMDSGGVFAQRMQNAAYGTTEKSGDAVRVYEGVLHDVTDGPNNELYAVVDEGWRFAVVRFDSSLKVLETMPFHADVATGESVRISGDVWVTPVIAYTASTPAGSRAVMRFIGARTPPTKRRSAR
jgi:hypothetical protein